MYIESNGTELGLPQHYLRRGWREHVNSGGPGAELQMQQPSGYQPHHMHRRHGHHMQGLGEGAGEYVTMMGDAPAAPTVVPTTVMQPVSHHSDTMMYVAAGAMVLGLAFVIYKATR